MSTNASFWLPKAASSTATHVDSLFYFVYYLCVLFFIIIIATTVYFVVKHRKRGGVNVKTDPIQGNTKLEIIWSVVPTILLIVIFVWGAVGWFQMNIPPANSLDVRVTAAKWFWSFTYPKEGITNPDLVVPVGTNVKLTMSSKDVIHSFYVADFRIKKDVLPNRYSVLWFDTHETGEHFIQCTEYCGTKHSTMLAKVRVLSKEDYAKWVEDGGDVGGAGMSSVDLGAKLYEAKGCNACHSIDGSSKVGPTLKGLYGTERNFADGSKATADDNYLRESILVPAAKIVKGYPNVMPAFKGQLNDKQTTALIDYIQSLK